MACKRLCSQALACSRRCCDSLLRRAVPVSLGTNTYMQMETVKQNKKLLQFCQYEG